VWTTRGGYQWIVADHICSNVSSKTAGNQYDKVYHGPVLTQFSSSLYLHRPVILSLKIQRDTKIYKFITMAHVPYLFSLGVIYDLSAVG